MPKAMHAADQPWRWHHTVDGDHGVVGRFLEIGQDGATHATGSPCDHDFHAASSAGVIDTTRANPVIERVRNSALKGHCPPAQGSKNPGKAGGPNPKPTPTGLCRALFFFSPVLATTLSGLSEVTGYHPGLFQPWAKVRNPFGVEIPPESFQI